MEKISHHELGQHIRQWLRQEGALKGTKALLSMFFCAVDDVEKEVDGQKETKCSHCGVYFQAKDWCTPSSCPACHWSRVD